MKKICFSAENADHTKTRPGGTPACVVPTRRARPILTFPSNPTLKVTSLQTCEFLLIFKIVEGPPYVIPHNYAQVGRYFRGECVLFIEALQSLYAVSSYLYDKQSFRSLNDDISGCQGGVWLRLEGRTLTFRCATLQAAKYNQKHNDTNNRQACKYRHKNNPPQVAA